VIALLLLAAVASLQSDSTVYTISPASRLEVQTGKAGLLSFAGHEHRVRARAFSGAVVYHASAPAESRVAIVIPTDSLEVLTPPDTEEIRKVTAAMRSDVLDVAHYPEIRLASRRIAITGDTAHVIAALTIRNQTREVPLDVKVEVANDTLRATSTFTIKQTDFAIKPYRGGPGGTVRVADRVNFDIHIVAVKVVTRP
jgi:polyisoprenoid-binding protein YceI